MENQTHTGAALLQARLVRRPWTLEDDKELKRLAPDMTAAQIAERMNRGADGIKHRARKLKVSLRKYGQDCSWAKYPNVMVEAAREMHDGGKKPRQISEELGAPYWAVCDWVYYKRGLGYGHAA